MTLSDSPMEIVPSKTPSLETSSAQIEDRSNALDKVIDWFIQTNYESIKCYVDKLRAQSPGIRNDDLAKKIVWRKSQKNGLVGAVTGLSGILALPVTIPADLVASWQIQIKMALCISYVYGHTPQTTDLKTDIYLILAGDAAKEALKRVGIEVSKEITKRTVQKYITRDVMVRIWKVVGHKIITKAGEKSLISFMKMVPLVGAPVGYAFDWSAAQIVGKSAILYYSGRA